MFSRIMLPLDGSPLAECALPYAESLARATGAKLLLVRSASAHTLPGADPSGDQLGVISEAESYLAGVAQRLGERGVETESAIPYGDAAGWIIDEIRIRNADAIVMATHGRSGLGRWIYGSVAEEVLAHSPVPVMLVRAWQCQTNPRTLVSHPRVLVPLDGSPFAEAAIDTALSVVEGLGGEIVLSEVVPVPTHVVVAEDGKVISYLDQQEEAFRREASDYLYAVAQRISARAATVQVSVDVQVGEPAESIIQVAHERDVTLIVMATHGRTGLARLMLGSVAAQVLRNGNVPLLLVRPAEVRAEAEAAAQPASLTTLTLTPEDVALIQNALGNLAAGAPTDERLGQRVQRLQRRLPAAAAETREPALIP